MSPVLSDDAWHSFGYKRRPKRGSIWYRLFPKRLHLETFIMREILTIGLIDVLDGIKHSKETSNAQLQIAIGVVDRVFTTAQKLYPADLFAENLFETYSLFLKTEESKRHEPVILRTMDILEKREFAKFWVGMTRLIAGHVNGSLLKRHFIAGVIEASHIENHNLTISMSEELYTECTRLLEDRILNT